jgi:hypothetical protein
VTIPVTIPETGCYAIDFLYANANGTIQSENKCAIRTLWDGDRRLGVVVMPQCGMNEYGIWKYTPSRVVRMEKGEHLLRLAFQPENYNMNIETNSAAISRMRLIRIN